MEIFPSSRTLLDLLDIDRNGLNRGRVKAMLRRGQGYAIGAGGVSAGPAGRGDDRYPNSVVKFLTELDKALADGGDVTGQQHPRDDLNARYYGREAGTELSPVELAWLDRLPSDPALVPYDDAVTLAGMSQYQWGIGSPSKRLINSIWQPVAEAFDARVADAQLAEARKPLWRIPDATAAVADCIQHEVPELSPKEALDRASDAVDDKLQARRERHRTRRDEAYAAVARVEEKVAARTSTDMPAPRGRR